MRSFKRFYLVVVLSMFLFNFSGCTVIFQKSRLADKEKISQLSSEIDKLSQAKQMLEDRLKQEIADKGVSLSMQDKGLVVTFLSEILFDSGKAQIKKEAYEALDKVEEVLQNNVVSGMDIGIEGHTDNQPIKYSGWKSNWELSGQRAISVLSYLVERGLKPERLSFMGYGEYRPVANNDTPEGKQSNRRVEIVVLPHLTKDRQQAEQKQIAETAIEAKKVEEPVENLK